MIKENRPHRLYADENFPQRAVQELRALGHDVLTLREDGKAGRGYPDDRVLRDAATSGRVLLTHDRRDFGRLHEARFPTGGSSSARKTATTSAWRPTSTLLFRASGRWTARWSTCIGR